MLLLILKFTSTYCLLLRTHFSLFPNFLHVNQLRYVLLRIQIVSHKDASLNLIIDVRTSWTCLTLMSSKNLIYLNFFITKNTNISHWNNSKRLNPRFVTSQNHILLFQYTCAQHDKWLIETNVLGCYAH